MNRGQPVPSHCQSLPESLTMARPIRSLQDPPPTPKPADPSRSVDRFALAGHRPNPRKGDPPKNPAIVDGDRRLDFEPLALEAHMTNGNLAALLGVSARTIYRWKKHGVPAKQADRAAISIGSHPAYIWMGE